MNFFEKLALLPILMDIVEDMAIESLKMEEEKKLKQQCCCCKSNEQKPIVILSKGHGVNKVRGWENVHPTCCRQEEPVMMDREPDGVDIHVDRPRQENYLSHKKWAQDMANYRCLIDQAKKCDWPCREPMKGIPNYVSHIQRDWYDEHPHCW